MVPVNILGAGLKVAPLGSGGCASRPALQASSPGRNHGYVFFALLFRSPDADLQGLPGTDFQGGRTGITLLFWALGFRSSQARGSCPSQLLLGTG